MISILSAKLTDWLRLRASVRELSRLSDRELNELGIDRDAISAVVRRARDAQAA